MRLFCEQIKVTHSTFHPVTRHHSAFVFQRAEPGWHVPQDLVQLDRSGQSHDLKDKLPLSQPSLFSCDKTAAIVDLKKKKIKTREKSNSSSNDCLN